MRVIPVEPQERRAVGQLFGLTFLVGSALLAVNVAGYSILLNRIGIVGLTASYLITAVVGIVFGVIDARLATHHSLRRRMVANFGTVSLAVLGLTITESMTDSVAVALLLPVVYELASIQSAALVFELASDRFDVRQSKRLLSLAGAGRWLAFVVFGLALFASGDAISPMTLLIAPCVLFPVSGVVGWLLASPADVTSTAEASGPITATAEPASGPTSKRLARIIVAQLMLLFAIATFADYLYLERADAVLDPGRVTAVLAVIGASEGIITLLLSLVAAGPILRRFGVPDGLKLQQVLLLVTGSGLLVVLVLDLPELSLILAVLIHLEEQCLRNAVGRPSVAVLYQPLARAFGTRLRARAEGPYLSAQFGLTALVAGAVVAYTDVAAFVLTGGVFVMTMTWLALNGRTRAAYVGALRTGLDRREFGRDVEFDANLRALIINRMADPDPLRALAAAELSRELGGDPGEALVTLLAHQDQRVRLAALRRAHEDGLTVPDQALRECWAVQGRRPVADPAVGDLLSEEALLVLSQAVSQGAEWAMAQAQHHWSAGNPSGAVALLSGPDPVSAYAHVQLAARSRDIAIRRNVAAALAAVGADLDSLLLASLLDDADGRVVEHALQAARCSDDPDIWRRVVNRASHPVHRTTATAALVAGDLHAGTALARAITLELPTASTGGGHHRRLLTMAARNGSSSAVLAVARVAAEGPATHRAAALTALGRARPAMGQDACRSVRSGLRAAADQSLALKRRAGSTGGRMYDAIRSAIAREHIAMGEGFRALGAAVEGRSLISAVIAADSRQVAAAIELLDGVIAKEDRMILSAIEAATPPADPDGTQRWEGDDAPDRWILALSTVGSGVHAPADDQDQSQMMEPVERVLALSRSDLFAETPPEVLLDLAALMHEHPVSAGTELFSAGDTGDHFFLVLEGEIAIVVNDRVVNRITPGQAFGELALLDPEPRTATARVEADGFLLSLAHDDFDDLLSDRPEVGRAMMSYLASRLRMATTGAASSVEPRSAPWPPPAAED